MCGKRFHRPKNRIKQAEFSKRAAAIILLLALFDLQICILAAFFGVLISDEIPVNLIKVIIGTFLVYCLKAYFGKKAEVRSQLEGLENIEESEENELD